MLHTTLYATHTVVCYWHQSRLPGLANLPFIISADCDKDMDSLFDPHRGKDVSSIICSQVQFSAQTTSYRIQLALKQKLIKRGRHTLAAPRGKKVSAQLSLNVKYA